MHSTNLYGMSKHKWPESDSLFIKLQGPTQRAIDESAALVRKIAEKHGGFQFQFARNAKEADELWQDRKNALYSGMALVDGCMS